MYGAVASSAPVKAQVNFEGYNDVVEHSFGDTLVNGSSQVSCCYKFLYSNRRYDFRLFSRRIRSHDCCCSFNDVVVCYVFLF